MKKFFLIGLLTLMAFMTNGLQASDGVKYLIVHLQDGQKVTFPLADEPVITVADNVLTVRTPEQQISVPFENLVNYLLSDKSGIDEGVAEPPELLKSIL